MPDVVKAVADAFGLAAAMTWEIGWALILGFAISAVVQAVVSKSEMSRLLPDASARRRRAQPGRARPQGLDGRPRPNGHVSHRRETVGADLLGARVHRDLALLPDGLGLDLEGRRRRTRPRRRARVVGAEGM